MSNQAEKQHRKTETRIHDLKLHVITSRASVHYFVVEMKTASCLDLISGV
jgi:hypothetical protein